jgi:hypothetical protein
MQISDRVRVSKDYGEAATVQPAAFRQVLQLRKLTVAEIDQNTNLASHCSGKLGTVARRAQRFDPGGLDDGPLIGVDTNDAGK